MQVSYRRHDPPSAAYMLGAREAIVFEDKGSYYLHLFPAARWFIA